MGISRKQYEKLTGKKAPKKNKNTIKIPQEEPKGIQYIKYVLKEAGIKHVCEYRFHDVRRFRFDIAVPELFLAIEYEGLMSKKSGHTTVGGFTSDCTKYNLAQINGWTVLRYTVMNFEYFKDDLKDYLSQPRNLTM